MALPPPLTRPPASSSRSASKPPTSASASLWPSSSVATRLRLREAARGRRRSLSSRRRRSLSEPQQPAASCGCVTTSSNISSNTISLCFSALCVCVVTRPDVGGRSSSSWSRQLSVSRRRWWVHQTTSGGGGGCGSGVGQREHERERTNEQRRRRQDRERERVGASDLSKQRNSRNSSS